MRTSPRRWMPRWLARAPLRLYDVGLGRLLGGRFLMLEHRGRRSGQVRRTVLEVVGRERGDPIVVSGLGRRSQWFQNVVADPRVHVTIGRMRWPAEARVLSPAEARAQLQRYTDQHPRAARRLAQLYADPGTPAPHLHDLAEVLPVLRFVASPPGNRRGDSSRTP